MTSDDARRIVVWTVSKPAISWQLSLSLLLSGRGGRLLVRSGAF
jgi:hypothetical protein